MSELLLTYWIQSVIIGLFQFAKILDLKDFSTKNFYINDRAVEPTPETKRTTAFFFLFHYGFFHFVYLIFIAAEAQGRFLVIPGLFASTTILFLNHLLSFVSNRTADRKRAPNIGQMMFTPYARIIPMHLTIILGATAGFPILLFLGLKTLADVVMHAAEHFPGKSSRRSSRPPLTSGIGWR